jgi:hypothetical protein
LDSGELGAQRRVHTGVWGLQETPEGTPLQLACVAAVAARLHGGVLVEAARHDLEVTRLVVLQQDPFGERLLLVLAGGEA